MNTSPKILIAEDSPTQAQRLIQILEQKGYSVISCVNGRQALETALQHKPDLIISDVVMPEMDGYELCREIKSDKALADIPLILVTTLSDPQDVIRGLECRADNFILKPYDERYLLGRVQYVLVNREMRETQHGGMGVEIFFNGHRHFITADRLQILNLLLSTYDAAIQRNRELSRAQEELRRLNTNLEAANKELESFSYSVSHDLQAPLRHIQGYVSLLEETASGQLVGESKNFLNSIRSAGEKMSRLIDDLLEFSRMGRAEMDKSAVALEPLVKDCIRNLEMTTKDRVIHWKVLPLPNVRGDLALLRQVFVNLLSNAVKYTRPRNPAEITIGSLNELPGEITIFVQDNGVGFDMKYADKLFGVFQRLHRASEFEGTGIGLANVQRIIVRHGGRVWAEAAPDKGATFYFTIEPVDAA